jgi:hypothetical protein
VDVDFETIMILEGVLVVVLLIVLIFAARDNLGLGAVKAEVGRRGFNAKDDVVACVEGVAVPPSLVLVIRRQEILGILALTQHHTVDVTGRRHVDDSTNAGYVKPV